jgi:hypothetical protein
MNHSIPNSTGIMDGVWDSDCDTVFRHLRQVSVDVIDKGVLAMPGEQQDTHNSELFRHGAGEKKKHSGCRVISSLPDLPYYRRACKPADRPF